MAETGSPLSHLAILAREHGVPTVVGHAGATTRYQEGDLLVVDGSTGTVRVTDATVIALPPRVVDLSVDPVTIGGLAMSARVLRTVLGGLTLVASGAYTFVYLYRWEWNRALMSAAIFIAAEVAVMGSLLSQRLKVISVRLDTQATAQPPVPTPAVMLRRERIHAAQPRPASASPGCPGPSA